MKLCKMTIHEILQELIAIQKIHCYGGAGEGTDIEWTLIEKNEAIDKLIQQIQE